MNCSECQSLINLRFITNHGAALMERRRYKQAIDTMSYGLQIAREAMLEKEIILDKSVSLSMTGAVLQPERRPTHDFFEDAAPVMSCSPSQHMEDANTTKPRRSTQKPINQKSATGKGKAFIFSRPMFCERDCSEQYNLEAFAFMMMFNMALCYHLTSRCPTHGRPADLQSALLLYELAYKMHLTDDLEVPLVHSCAIVNNMAELHIRLQNKSPAKWCLSTLLSILMYYLVEERRLNHELQNREPSDVDLEKYLNRFLANASKVILRNPGTAAAA